MGHASGFIVKNGSWQRSFAATSARAVVVLGESPLEQKTPLPTAVPRLIQTAGGTSSMVTGTKRDGAMAS